jgi:hypothetical protein|tara:strand:+ start:10815 stop:11453 length:639 start_codon:yes stop_codon:yes gene_type:complete
MNTSQRTRQRGRNVAGDILDTIINLSNEGYGGKEIRDQLRVLFPERRGEIPHVRTVQRIVEPPKNETNDQRERRLLVDSQFEWHRFGEYGIPWEAQEFLLDIWKVIWSGEVDWRENERRYSAREVIWWYRVHIAAPDMPITRVITFGQRFAANEIAVERFGSEPIIEGLYQAIAFRDSVDQYNQLLELGWLKPMTVFAGSVPPLDENGGIKK